VPSAERIIAKERLQLGEPAPIGEETGKFLRRKALEVRVVRTFDEPVSGSDGKSYVAKVCGRRRVDGRWESWIEFVPAGGKPVLRSRRETTQSDLRYLERWAKGLTRVYIEGSLERTLHMQVPRRYLPPARPEVPHFDAPSPDPAAGPRLAPDDAVLNPMLEYRRGESHLRKKLAELSPSDLRTIAWAYGMEEGGRVDVDGLSGGELVELIVVWSRDRAK
jgi:hypothetical protein